MIRRANQYSPLRNISNTDVIFSEAICSQLKWEDFLNFNRLQSHVRNSIIIYIRAKNAFCNDVQKGHFTKKTWHFVTANFTQLENLTLKNLEWLEDHHLEYVIYSQTLKSFEVIDCVYITGSFISSVARYCPNLSELSLNGCSAITTSGLCKISRLRNLRKLSLSGAIHLTDNTLTRIIASNRNLECLKLRECPNLTDASLEVIALFCPKLKHLELSHNRNYSDFQLSKTLENHHSLTCLAAVKIDNMDILSLNKLADLQFLKRIEISVHHSITPGWLYEILSNCEVLTTVRISGFKGIVSRLDMQQFARLQPQVTRITLRSVKNLFDSDIGQFTATRGLKELFLESNNGEDEIYDKNFIKRLALNSPNLARLHYINNEVEIDEGIELLAENCKRLESLHIDNFHFTGKYLNCLLENNALKDLSLTSYCLSNLSLLSIPSQPLNLVSLEINELQRIKSKTLVSLLKKTPLLQSLKLSSVIDNFEDCGVDNEVLVTIKQHCPDLTSLNINKIKDVSLDGLMVMFEKRLTKVWLYQCWFDAFVKYKKSPIYLLLHCEELVFCYYSNDLPQHFKRMLKKTFSTLRYKLRKCKIHVHPGITDLMLKVLRKCHHLEQLQVGYQLYSNPTSFIKLTKECRKLRILQIGTCPDVSMELVRSCLPNCYIDKSSEFDLWTENL